MPPSPNRRRWIARLGALAAATAIALLLGELVARWLPEPRTLGAVYFRDPAGVERTRDEAAALGLVVRVEPNPRERWTFAPGRSFFICYRDHQQLRRNWLDDRGCVEVAFSRWGIREREELGHDKPPGQKRVVCIGDSFTLGWGIPVEDTWVRRLEAPLRGDGSDVRTLNCGGAGAIVVDEYQWGLEHRFGLFQPDMVIVSVCLNDLMPTSGGLCQLRPQRRSGSALLDRLAGLLGPGPLDLDPSIDWVGLLLAQPADSPLYGPDVPYDAMWSQGTPQRSLLRMQAWCSERRMPLLVVVWPFLQGLGPGEFYPFAPMHERVRAFCEENSIPFLDLLPVLRGHRPEDLWVTPADLHANPMAQALAVQALAPFVSAHRTW